MSLIDCKIYLLLKNLTSDKIWHEPIFITEVNPHLTRRFCGLVFGPTTISKTVSQVFLLIDALKYFQM